MKTFTITGATVFLPGGPAEVAVTFTEGLISAIGGPVRGTRVDGTGLILAPALVDIHGDAFERQVMPRPGVFVPLEIAILETDRQLAANGIATAYHALTLSWEPGLRSVGRGQAFVEALEALAPRLTVENRVQLRWETFCFEALPLMEKTIASALTPSVAFNDHTSMGLLHPDVKLQDRPFELDPGYPVADFKSEAFLKKMGSRAVRSGISAQDYADQIVMRWNRRDEVAEGIGQVSRWASKAGAAMLSHDDSQARTRDFYRDHDARVSEFPMRREVAQAARDGGDTIAFGAPNAARGGSHLGSPGAGDMVAAGLCDMLASDYYYPAMLASIARMEGEGRGKRTDLWRLISTAPARAMGLTDRGEIAEGKRADLVLVDWPDGGAPAIRATFSAGRPAYRANPAG